MYHAFLCKITHKSSFVCVDRSEKFGLDFYSLGLFGTDSFKRSITNLNSFSKLYFCVFLEKPEYFPCVCTVSPLSSSDIYTGASGGSVGSGNSVASLASNGLQSGVLPPKNPIKFAEEICSFSFKRYIIYLHVFLSVF